MKLFVLSLFSFILFFTAAGCSCGLQPEKPPEKTPAPTPIPTPIPTPKPPQLTEEEKEKAREKYQNELYANIISHINKITKDKNLCNTPKEIKEAWLEIRSIDRGNLHWNKAKTATYRLEQCRKKCERSFSRAGRKSRIAQREQFVKKYERRLLDVGIDSRVRATGQYKDSFVLTWILVSRVIVHQLGKDGELLKSLQDMGFKKASFKDGYSESWNYSLHPESENNIGGQVLEKMGIGKPLVLK